MHFWQNGERCRCGTHRARMLARPVRSDARRDIACPVRFPLAAALHPFHRSRHRDDAVRRTQARSSLAPSPHAPTAASRRCCSCTAATATAGAGTPYFLPWFARAGLGRRTRCQPARPRRLAAARETLFVAGLDDYVADVEHVAAQLAVAAGADRPFDGRGGRRAAARDAPGARRGAAGARAAGRTADDRRAARDRAARLPAAR